MASVRKFAAIALVGSLAAAGLELSSPTLASAATVELTCAGKSGDNASSLGDSKATLGALAAFTGGGGLSFSVDVKATVPAKTTPTSGPFDAKFDLALTMPATIVKAARDTLKLTKVNVSNASFGVNASGAGTASLKKSVASIDVDLTKDPVVVKQTISGSVKPTSAGKISYTPGDTSMTINLNTTFQGIKLNYLTVTCTGNAEIASTAVQVPGAPIVPSTFYIGGETGRYSFKQILPGEIKSDGGNPIIPSSLRVVAQSPAGGTASVLKDGVVLFKAPSKAGVYYVTHEVCAQSKPVAAIPGVNTQQSLTWPESYIGRDLNAHPYSMALSFKGAKSAPIPLSYLMGQPSPTGEGQQTFFDQFFAQFQAPSAARIRAALESLPTVGAGNVDVTSTSAGYTITFKGALGGAAQPKVEVVDWNTWLPSAGLATLLALLNPPAPGPGSTTTTTIPKPPETAASLDAKLAAGSITFDQWLAGRGELLKADILKGATTPANIKTITGLFPKIPEVVTTVTGKPPVAATETGPLCTRFNIGYFILNAK